MHFLGFNVMPRRIPDSFHSWNSLSSIGSGITFLSFGPSVGGSVRIPSHMFPVHPLLTPVGSLRFTSFLPSLVALFVRLSLRNGRRWTVWTDLRDVREAGRSLTSRSRFLSLVPFRTGGRNGWEEREALASLTPPCGANDMRPEGETWKRGTPGILMTRLSITSSGHRLSPPSCDHCWWLKGLEVIVRRWERSVSRVSRLSFGSPFVTQSLPVPTAHLPQLGGRLLTSPPTSLRSAHGTNERSDVRRERERHATRHSSLRSRFVWRVSLFTTSPISYLVHRSVSLLSSLVHDGWC